MYYSFTSNEVVSWVNNGSGYKVQLKGGESAYIPREDATEFKKWLQRHFD